LRNIEKLKENEYLNKDELTFMKSELDEIRKQKLESLKVRSKAVWVDQREKPTK